MPYLRCTCCGRNELYSPKRFERRGCPDCGSDLAFDRQLEAGDRPPSRDRRERQAAGRQEGVRSVRPPT